MAQSRPLLERLLNTPDLANIVPHLRPEVLHRVIQHCGLEDCAKFVALATPQQLARILDADVWRVRGQGIDEELDADRFGLWLEVLLQSAAAVATEKLVGLDMELLIAGFARHAAVFDSAAVSPFTTLDGEQAGGRVLDRGPVAEIGGYVVEARRSSAGEALVELLVSLESEQPEYFHRLMRGCVRLSNGPREADGLHHLLEDDAQDMFDLACDREARREKLGYLTPPQARAFLQAARELRLDADAPPGSPIARAYFLAMDSTPPQDGEVPRESAGALPASNAESASGIEADVIAGVVELLREAGVLTPQPRARLAAADVQPARLALIEAYVESHAGSEGDLAYLANSVIAGCSIQGRTFTVHEASDAAVAACNLGLENWPDRWRDHDLITAFQVGWSVLHRDVGMYAAERLLDIAADIRTQDRDIQLRLSGLRRKLTECLRDRTPWRARGALDVILMLDAPSWAGLLGLIEECPLMHASIAASRHACHAIKPADFEFISQNSQIETVRVFLASLPSALTR
jgi:hypothetical protein